MRKFVILMTLMLAFVLAACTPAATPVAPTPAGDTGQAEEPTAEPAEPTEAPAEEPTEAPAEEPTAEPEATEATTDTGSTDMEDMGALAMNGDLLVLDAGGCDYGGKFEKIEAVDPLTVVFTMCQPDPAFLAKIAFEGFGIQPMEHLIETGGTGDLLEQPIGTGPYKLDSWSRGDSIVLTANEDY